MLEEAYVSEQAAEQQRAERDKATQFANIVVPAEVSKQRQIVEADAEAEKVRRIQQGKADGVRAEKQAEADGIMFVKEAEAGGLKAKLIAEADGLRSRLLAEAEGAQAVLVGKAKGFNDLIQSCQGPTGAQQLLITELLPQLVEAQVKAIANLKIDKLTVWDSGKGPDGKGSTAGFLSGLAGSVPPLHELAKNVGVELPGYLGKLESTPTPPPAPPAEGGQI